MSDPELPGFSPAPVSVPEDPQPSVWGGIRRLFSSSKYVLVLLAVVGVVVMNLAGRISGDAALAAIGALVSVAVGATAFEDAAEKKGGRPMGPAATSALMSGFQNIMALVPAVLQARRSSAPPDAVPTEFLEKVLPYLRGRGYQLPVGTSLCQLVATLNQLEFSDVEKLLGPELTDLWVSLGTSCVGADSLKSVPVPVDMDS